MIEVNRRNFIKGGMAAAAICLTGCGDSDNPFVVTPNGGVPGPNFLQPPVLQSANGSLSTTFDVRYVNTTLRTPVGSRNCSLRTWNGFVGGPTLRVRPGDRLTVQVNNQLPANTDPVPPDHNTPHHFNTINLHTHGLHVSPSQDDVLTPIPPGTSKTYVYDIPANHPCGTFWYHAHKHGSTAMHLMSGMAGLIIVEGEVDNDPGVAEAAQLDFVIQEINLKGLSDLNADPSATYEVPDYTTKSPFAAGDSFFIVNGAFFPELTVNPGRTIRLRILNGSTRNTMPISVPGAQLTVISLDGITLPQPLTLDTIRLAPANRADVVLRFDEPGTFTVRKEEFKNGGGAGRGVQPSTSVGQPDDPRSTAHYPAGRGDGVSGPGLCRQPNGWTLDRRTGGSQLHNRWGAFRSKRRQSDDSPQLGHRVDLDEYQRCLALSPYPHQSVSGL